MDNYIDQIALNNIISKIKKLAIQYKRLTGKPIGITGEVGEFTAAKLLNLKLSKAFQPGYDAIGPDGRRIQIKSRCVKPKLNQRVGRIKFDYEFDTVMLVLMDEELEPLSIHEARRTVVEEELMKNTLLEHNKQGSLWIKEFIAISSQIWTRSIKEKGIPNSSQADLNQLTDTLMSFSESIATEDLLPTVIPEAGHIVANDPYAFAIAVCLDRGTKAEIIWTIPFDIKTELGHLDPFRIYKMTINELERLFAVLPRHPRYINDAPRTLQELTRIVVEKFNGDSNSIWKGKKAFEVKKTFESIYGVGPGIASMGVLLIERAFPIKFEDRENMDIKPDVHTTRVLYRLGVSTQPTVEAALEATRKMNPEFPGKVDAALWEIGRKWCRPSKPDCPSCPVTSNCAKILEDLPLSEFGASKQISDITMQGSKRKIVLISCVSQKRSIRSKAKDLYISALFQKSLAYARRLNPDKIFVLSSLYGLVDLEKEIDPYNLTLNTLSSNEIKRWADLVLRQLNQVVDIYKDHFIILAGNNYRKYLLPHLHSYEIPFEGLPIGKQLQALSR